MKLEEIRSRRRARRTHDWGNPPRLQSTVLLILGAAVVLVTFFLMSR
jgi:hypothetical protein